MGVEQLADALQPQFYLTTGSYFEEKVEPSRALEIYQALVDRHPTDASAPRALVRQARILQKLGEPLLAEEKLRCASAHAACPPALREMVERMLALGKSGTN